MDTIVVETAAHPDSAVIWMHGLGADGNDFVDLVPEVTPPGAKIRFIFPNAPVRPVTVNGGFPMRAWYDIVSPDLGENPDIAGILQSAQEIETLARSQIEQGIPAGRIVLAGFSQGGVVALQLGCRFPERLAGILALSTYSPTAHLLNQEASACSKGLPIFVGHGSFDPVVPPALNKEARVELEANGFSVEFHSYPMPHSVCPQEVRDIQAFLGKVLY
jgi:phospholipase/carboxylesterase